MQIELLFILQFFFTAILQMHQLKVMNAERQAATEDQRGEFEPKMRTFKLNGMSFETGKAGSNNMRGD